MYKNENLWINLVGLGVLTIAIVALITSGVRGLGRTSERYEDVAYFYAAGKILLRGDSPYDNKNFLAELRAVGLRDVDVREGQGDFFVYPFTSTPLCLAMASMPNLAVAQDLMLVLNLTALTALAILSIRLVTNAEQPRPASQLLFTRWLMPSLLIASPFTERTIWLGQITLLVATFLVGGWYCVRRNEHLLGGILLGLATMKPQFMVFLCLWLLLDRYWRVLLTIVMTAAVLSSYIFWIEGPLSATRDWLVALHAYQADPIDNQLGSSYVTSLPSILAASGIHSVPTTAALLVGGLMTLVLWKYRARMCPDDVLGILLGMQLGLVYSHPHDLTLLMPMTAAFWLHLANRRKAWPAAAAFIGIMFVVGKISHMPGLSSLTFSLGIMLLIALGLLIYLSLTSQHTSDGEIKPGAESRGIAAKA